MGSEKRDRQREGRLARMEAEAAAARRARNKRLGIRFAVAAVVIIGALFAYSLIAGDDGDDETAASDESTTTTVGPDDPAASCASGTPPAEWTNPTLAEEVLARTAPDPAPPPADTAADALETETLTEGEGEAAAAGDCIWVHYIGKVPDGTVFDQSWERGQPIGVTLGQGGVIAGWDEGLVGAKVGERRRLVIGSDNAYGAEGRPPTIQPDTPLAFEVDIVDVIRPGSGDTSSTTAPADSTDTTAAPS